MKNSTESKPDVSELEKEFKNIGALAERFSGELVRQVQRLVDADSLSLSFPIQQRVKTWESLVQKLERKALTLKALQDLDDLVGLRLILQFKRDALKVCNLIEQNFKVLRKYDTSDRLGTDQFGYSSMHFIVELPDSWLVVPTFSQMKGWRAEIQVRTTSQHIWAAASHTLQYKQEDSVPAPMRRAIHRVSALLEVVDLEFERLLKERESYRSDSGPINTDAILNVDLLEHLLDALLPEQNKASGRERYNELLDDLAQFGISDRGVLTQLIENWLPEALKLDKSRVKVLISGNAPVPSRLAAGVYFTHIGLVRQCLSLAFGDAWKSYVAQR